MKRITIAAMLLMGATAAMAAGVPDAEWCGGKYDPARGTNFGPCPGTVSVAQRDHNGKLIVRAPEANGGDSGAASSGAGAGDSAGDAGTGK